MRFYSAASDQLSAEAAAEQVIQGTLAAMRGRIDTLFAFITGHHARDAQNILERFWLDLDPQSVVGCSAEGVIGQGREIERSPGVVLLAAEWPGVRVHAFHVGGRPDWREVLDSRDALLGRLGIDAHTRAIVALGDPFTTPIDPLMAALDEHAAGVPLVGGMASAGQQPGQNVLFCNDQVFENGLVGCALAGPLKVETIVSQGCRPIGKPWVVTRSHDNVIEQLGGKPAMQALQDCIDSVTPADRKLLEHGLLIGRAMSEYRDTFGRGDFLVRNVIGVEQAGGAVAVADYIKTGQTVQFHVRDAASADEDFNLMLESRKSSSAAGALLFSCNGRGRRLFDTDGHDVLTVGEALPETPLAGFFAMGELGPVGNRNFIHGQTASLALFSPAEES